MSIQSHYVYQTHSISYSSALSISLAITPLLISSTFLIGLSTRCCCGMIRSASTQSVFLLFDLFYSMTFDSLINKSGYKIVVVGLNCAWSNYDSMGICYFMLTVLDLSIPSRHITTTLESFFILFITSLYCFYFIFVT